MTEITPELWQRISKILDLALQCDPAERDTFVDQLCDGDEDLRCEVRSLLSYETFEIDVLKAPDVARHRSSKSFSIAESRRKEGSEIGHQIGPYRLLEQLGAGGMGTVFLAVRNDDFRQKVALKQIRRRGLSQDLRSRFENERQILAELEHPNIARILDGGSTEDGLPYFTMEYVEGQPIDCYCDQHQLSIYERLKLVLQVCSALQLAHQNLVVHRDLKPGNILVTQQGLSKLLDFGIAKHLAPSAMPHKLSTQAGQQLMTLKYASPEQIEGRAITTASDIYSLGALIYVLLTGHDPYPQSDGNPLALQRAICELALMRPSVAVKQTVEVANDPPLRRTPEGVSRARGTSPRQLRNRLDGDLDAIVLKAMRKRPEHRYHSVELLAHDLRRHLRGLSVTACKGTFRYLAKKFVRRHRLSLGAAAVVMLTLSVSALPLTRMWQRAAAEKEKARVRAERTVELLEDLIEVFDPEAIDQTVTPLRFLDHARAEITADLRAEPEMLARLLSGRLTRVYRRLGHFEEAQSSLDQALIILRKIHEQDHPEIADVLHNQGSLLFRMGDYRRAEAHFRDALTMRQRMGLNDESLVGPLSNLASCLAQRGEFAEAMQRYRQVLGLQRRLGHPQLAMTLRNLGMLFFTRGDPDQAEHLLSQALRLELAKNGAASLEVAGLQSALGRVLTARGELEAAERALNLALAVRRRHLGPDHVDLARAERNLAAVLLKLEEHSTAAVLLDHAQAALRRVKPPDDWEVAELESLLGAYLAGVGRHQEAKSCLVDSYRTLEASRGRESIYTRQALERVVAFYETRDMAPQAIKHRILLKEER